jgi:hypothetical protein
MSDVGLLRKMANVSAGHILQKSDEFKEFKGAMAENYVLCEMTNLYGTDQMINQYKLRTFGNDDFKKGGGVVPRRRSVWRVVFITYPSAFSCGSAAER